MGLADDEMQKLTSSAQLLPAKSLWLIEPRFLLAGAKKSASAS
jgi:hypothetical protein